MYFYMDYSNNQSDKIVFDSSNPKDFNIYVGARTDSIYFKDGQFYGQNQSPFVALDPANGKTLACSLTLNNTILVTYKNKWFYDIPYTKPQNNNGSKVIIKITEEDEDAMYLESLLKHQGKSQFAMTGYMMPMFDQFVMWINDEEHRNIHVVETPIEDSLQAETITAKQ